MTIYANYSLAVLNYAQARVSILEKHKAISLCNIAHV